MLEYRLTYATIRCLNMKQGGDGWHNIGHIGLPGGCTMLDSPAHENQWNMSVVRIPLTMIGSLHAVGIVVRLQYDGNITATLTVVTISQAYCTQLSSFKTSTTLCLILAKSNLFSLMMLRLKNT
mgnify:CR=1 FL=1